MGGSRFSLLNSKDYTESPSISSITILEVHTRRLRPRPIVRLYLPSPLFFAPNFVMKSLLYGQACEKKQVSPLSLSHEMLSVIRKRLKGRARSVRHPSHAAHVAHLCVQSALPRDVPRREQADERSVLVHDDGVVDLFSLEQLRGVVPVHVGPRRVQVGAHDLAHGSVQWDLRRGGAGGEKLKKLFRELFAIYSDGERLFVHRNRGFVGVSGRIGACIGSFLVVAFGAGSD